MEHRRTPPWTVEEVESLNGFQRSAPFHPFTCGTKEKHQQIEHPSGWTETVDEVLVATTDGWTCKGCDYTQDWAHGFMMDGSWKRFPKFGDA